MQQNEDEPVGPYGLHDWLTRTVRRAMRKAIDAGYSKSAAAICVRVTAGHFDETDHIPSDEAVESGEIAPSKHVQLRRAVRFVEANGVVRYRSSFEFPRDGELISNHHDLVVRTERHTFSIRRENVLCICRKRGL